MYLLIKRFIFFVFFAFCFYLLVMPLWASFLPFYMSKNLRSCIGCYGHTLTRMQEVKKVTDPDVLIIGSSHAYRGIDPRIFKADSINAFNLGSSAQSPINTKMLLKQYIDNVKPKLIIYEIYVGTLGIDGLTSSLDLLSNNKIDFNAIKMAKETNNFVAYNTLIFSFFRQLYGLDSYNKEEKNQGDDTYISETGFVATKYRENKLEKYSVQKWEINPTQFKALVENINYIKQKNIPYYLVQAPITQGLYQSKLNNNETDSLLSTLGPYKNYQNKLDLNDSTDF